MDMSVKSRAERLFAATQKEDTRALEEKQTASRERAQQVARLRALRLAKEAAEEAETKAPFAAEHNLSGLGPQVAIGKDVEGDLLEIPPFLRRQAD